MRLLEHGHDHSSEVVCANCLDVIEEQGGVLFDRGFVSGAKAGICRPCIVELKAVAADVEADS